MIGSLEKSTLDNKNTSESLKNKNEDEKEFGEHSILNKKNNEKSQTSSPKNK